MNEEAKQDAQELDAAIEQIKELAPPESQQIPLDPSQPFRKAGENIAIDVLLACGAFRLPVHMYWRRDPPQPYGPVNTTQELARRMWQDAKQGGGIRGLNCDFVAKPSQVFQKQTGEFSRQVRRYLERTVKLPA